MTGNAYQNLAMRTHNENVNGYDMLRNAVYGLNGESGEVIDILKKYEFQGHELQKDKIIEELGDVLWYIALACTALNVPLEAVMQLNIDKLSARYPSGFSTDRSVNRESTKDI